MKKIFICLLFFTSFLSAEMSEASLCWNGKYFKEWNRKAEKAKGAVIDERTIYFSCNHLSCYGHAVLDGIIPLYDFLKNKGLLDTPINLCIGTSSQTQKTQTFQNVIKLIKDIFKIKQVIVLNDDQKEIKRAERTYFKKLVVNEYVPFSTKRVFTAFYKAYPDSFKYIYALKDFGFKDNIVFQDKGVKDNLVKEFVDYVKKAYGLDLPMIKNRIFIPARPYSRKILNLDELKYSLERYGYDVVIADFEKMTVKEQIAAVLQAEYLMGTYGSNLVNAIFLKPEANVVILWPKYTKYFWSRRYCVIHSAFLAAGVKLIEYDKPDYDIRDSYREPIHVDSYFYRDGSITKLRPEKIDMEAIIKYPLDGMYEMLNVDIYVDPEEVIYQLRHS